jgi:hypothetical protein
MSLRVLALAVALLGAPASATVFATTFVPGGPLVADWVIWPLAVGSIAVHLETVRTYRSRRAELTRALRETPKGLVAAAMVVFALSMQAVLTGHGSPERQGHAYFLRNHTELRPVSRAEYRYAERKEERIFAGIALVFYLVALIVHAPPGRDVRGFRTPPRGMSPPRPDGPLQEHSSA